MYLTLSYIINLGDFHLILQVLEIAAKYKLYKL